MKSAVQSWMTSMREAARRDEVRIALRSDVRPELTQTLQRHWMVRSVAVPSGRDAAHAKLACCRIRARHTCHSRASSRRAGRVSDARLHSVRTYPTSRAPYQR